LYHCPICNSNKSTKLQAEANYDKAQLDSYAFASRKLPEYMHHKIIECTACRLLFCVDIPDAKTLHTLYKDAAYDSANEAKTASNTYMKYLNKFAVKTSSKNRAMDIGTGEGSFLKLLLKAGYKEVVGIEPSKAPIAYADESVRPFIVNDIFNAGNFEENSFDLISLFQTIEHIPEPMKLVKDISKLLKPDGIFFVACHDYLAPVNRLMGVKSPIYDIEHLQLFSENSICKLLTQSGFSQVKSFNLRNSYPLHYWTKLFPMNKKIKSKVLNILDSSRLGNIKISVNVGNIGAIAIRGIENRPDS
jgi:SAM-dependent methyltransferase